MFDEVRQPAFALRLVKRTGADVEPDYRRPLGRVILPQDVAHPVVQYPEMVLWIDRDVALLERP